jgi:riboflavin synthase
MFTGLIAEIGTIRQLRRLAAGVEWTIVAPTLASQLKVGDSINVAGACQTVESIGFERFSGTAIRETLKVTTFARWSVGHRVNLELALRADDRLGGHLVGGHVDTIGYVRASRRDARGHWLEVSFPRPFDRWAVPKGSIALDGVSLTIAAKQPGSITAALIPETLARTTLDALRVGDPVNVEFDQLVKAAAPDLCVQRVDEQMLARSGW